SCYRLEVAAHRSLNWASVCFPRDGYIRAKRCFAIRHIELPPDPEQREPLFQQKTVAEIRSVLRIDASGGEVEESQHSFIAAIRYFKKYRSIAPADIFRLDHVEVRGELDFSCRILRSLVDIGNDLIRRVPGIDCKMNLSRKLFIAAGRSEGFAR